MNATPQTLSREGFEQCRPVAGEGGRSWRAFCPFHGSDRQRSLRLVRETGRFVCFACGVWGYLRESDYRSERRTWEPKNSSVVPIAPQSRASKTSKTVSLPANVESTLRCYQTALPGSWGERYLSIRGIPLSLAQAFGVGYAAAGTWLHARRDWKWGRLVFPHTNPGGQVVNLYGRAVGSEEKVPKAMRHDHLPGAKGFFNAPALRNAEKVYVCEGPFDALSLVAAGRTAAVAIFGVDGWNWEWTTRVRELVFAMDTDVAGQRWKDIARGAVLQGKRVSFVETSGYGGCKDINEAWRLGVLQI